MTMQNLDEARIVVIRSKNLDLNAITAYSTANRHE